jgi:hypothetical protein
MAVDKQEIWKLLREWFEVTGNVTISDSGLVSVTGSVELRKKCEQLPVSFDRVGNKFDCSEKELKTLIGAPQWVGGYFNCSVNQLEKLEGAPQWVGGDFGCRRNQLTSLIGAPQWVGGRFFCYDNQLKTLEGAPRRVGGNFACITNPLESLKGIPLHIGRQFVFTYDKKLPLCETLTSRMKEIVMYGVPAELDSIINKYLNTGYQKMLPFATELIKAGYKDNAWL